MYCLRRVFGQGCPCFGISGAGQALKHLAGLGSQCLGRDFGFGSRVDRLGLCQAGTTDGLTSKITRIALIAKAYPSDWNASCGKIATGDLIWNPHRHPPRDVGDSPGLLTVADVTSPGYLATGSK